MFFWAWELGHLTKSLSKEWWFITVTVRSLLTMRCIILLLAVFRGKAANECNDLDEVPGLAECEEWDSLKFCHKNKSNVTCPTKAILFGSLYSMHHRLFNRRFFLLGSVLAWIWYEQECMPMSIGMSKWMSMSWLSMSRCWVNHHGCDHDDYACFTWQVDTDSKPIQSCHHWWQWQRGTRWRWFSICVQAKHGGVS